MTRFIDIGDGADQLEISFPYEETIVAEVRGLPDRSWDPQSKNWYVPLEHLEVVLRRLESYHFKLTPDLRQYCRDEGIDPEAVVDDDRRDVYLPVPRDTFSISKLNQEAKSVLDAGIPDNIWLVGEVQSFDRNRDRGHAYFELVERPTEDADPMARISAVAFEDDRQRIESRLRSETDGVELRDGLVVRVQGAVDLYDKNGSYQFIIRDIDPVYTKGEIHRNREKILEHLEELGIRNANLARDWPRCPLRIGLITSYESDAYRDFSNELEHAGYGFSLTTYDAKMQGEATESTVLQGLEYFSERSDDFDLVAIVRGGGSRSDLAYFDTEKIGEAICQHPLKIISGIGHHRDQCLVDLIAESQKTPTAAGQAIVERVRAFIDRIEEIEEKLRDRVERHVETRRYALKTLGHRLQRLASSCLNEQQIRLGESKTQLELAVRGRIRGERRNLDQRVDQIRRLGRYAIRGRSQRLSQATERLIQKRWKLRLNRDRDVLADAARNLKRYRKRRIREATKTLEDMEKRLRALHPDRVLGRGFALVRDEKTIIETASEVPADRPFFIQFTDGDIRVKKLTDDT